VIVSTPYGESDSSVANETNTFTVISLFGWNMPATVKETVITAQKTKTPVNTDESFARIDPQESGVMISTSFLKRGDKRQIDSAGVSEVLDKPVSRTDTNRVLIAINDRSGYRLFPGYRGPPQGAD
jgi:hypothetical protein